MQQLPAYRDLPLRKELPPHSAWGVFGDDDDVGTVNLLTPERVRHAATLVLRGEVFPLNWRLDMPRPSIMGRKSLNRTQLTFDVDVVGSDDYYDTFYPQASSQWDALKHVGNPTYGFYNGRQPSEVLRQGATVLGIQVLANRGIVGRFVLVDIDRYFATCRETLSQTDPVEITVQDLDGALSHQDVQLSGGDILLLRFGWIQWYENLADSERVQLASLPAFPSPGLAPGQDTEEWMWDNHVAVIATDNPMVEVMPPVANQLHYRLIPLLGMMVGEMFRLDELALDCATTRSYEGMFSAAPLNSFGGSGSTANALAIK